MKINSVQGIAGDVTKAMTPFQGAPDSLEDMSSTVVEREQVKPLFLTTLLGGNVQDEFYSTDTFKYDAEESTLVVPAGKQFTGFGPRVNKDGHSTFRFGIGSYGISGNVAPADYANLRSVGGMDVDTEANQLLRLEEKMATSWELFYEQQLAYILKNDANYTAGAYVPEFNYFTEITGGSRSAPTNISFSGGDENLIISQIEAVTDLLDEEAIRAGEMGVRYVCLCGKNFFNDRAELELFDGLARDVKGTYDFASEQMTANPIGSQSFNVKNFVGSRDGVTYIKASFGVGGSDFKIPDEDAVFVPINASDFLRRAYAPAKTRTYANTVAQAAYAWGNIDDRAGVTRWEESNYLMYMTKPTLIRWMRSA